MARYPNAIWRSTDKHGYGDNDVHLHQGLVIHSAEGSLAGLFSVLDGTRQASWHFSVAQDGRVYQHVDTDRIAWTNGSLQANKKFWGIECEGGGPGNSGELLTLPQYRSLQAVVRWLWDTHNLSVYRRQATLWEHREMTRYGATSTSCPSGRIPWARLMADLQEKEDMTDAEWQRVKDLVASVKEQLVERDDGLHQKALGAAWVGKQQAIIVSRTDLAAHKEEPHGGDDGLKRGDTVTLK